MPGKAGEGYINLRHSTFISSEKHDREQINRSNYFTNGDITGYDVILYNHISSSCFSCDYLV